MPPTRTHDVLMVNEMDDDDGMPPLVDNPNPPGSMSFTFFTDMTPISADSTEPMFYEMAPETSILAALPDSNSFFEGPLPAQGDAVRPHGKKRDASYIPRPPNAFILFRSSFIKSQQVPGKVEGNHSTLSKIVGMYWKTLPREEREVWEAKAHVALAEHRKKYPDWRFRPGANALAKLKVKDNPGTHKRRNSQNGRKSKGDTEPKEKSDELRCAKIADFLVEGKTGVDLEAALKEWESSPQDSRVPAGRSGVVRGKGANKKERAKVVQTAVKPTPDGIHDNSKDDTLVTVQQPSVTVNVAEAIASAHGADTAAPRSVSPDTRFEVPLTAMFKRSLSAPALQTPSFLQEPVLCGARRNSSVDVLSQASFQGPLSPPEEENTPSTDSEQTADSPSPLPLSPVFERGTLAHWSDPFELPMSPSTPGFGYDDFTSPAPSPIANVFDSFSFPSPVPTSGDNAKGPQMIPANNECYRPTYNTYDSSFSTLTDWAGDMTMRAPAPEPAIVGHVVGGYEWDQGIYDMAQHANGLNTYSQNPQVGVM